VSERRPTEVRSHLGVSPQEARGARARAWRFVFDCWEQKKAAGEVGGEEHARKESKDVSRNQTIPRH
jgi:hypothetical protein